MAPVVRLTKDEKGSITIQAMLYVVLLVLILIMAFELWKVISVKQSLKAATYQAARFVSLNGLLWRGAANRSMLQENVWRFVNTELHNNPFVPDDSQADVGVSLLIPHTDWCEQSTFQLTVVFRYAVPIPHLGGASQMEYLTLQQNAGGPLQCQ
jgi:hypothetical protein